MNLDVSLRATDVAIVLATLCGPILAVQIQKRLERGRAIQERRLAIFRAMMATRASLLSPEHVQALNAIPVEFYGSSRSLRDINDAWKLYLDHLSVQQVSGDLWLQRRADLFVDLLYKMSAFLGYEFNKSQLEKDVYSPTAHGNIETEQSIIRQGLARIFIGETAFPMAVKEFPSAKPSDSAENSEGSLG